MKPNSFAKVPERLIGHPSLLPVDVAVFAALALYVNRKTGLCYPAQRTITARTGTSKGGIQRSVRRLVAAGFVVIEKPGGPRRSTTYRLSYDPEVGHNPASPDTQHDPEVGHNPASPDTQHDPEVGHKQDTRYGSEVGRSGSEVGRSGSEVGRSGSEVGQNQKYLTRGFEPEEQNQTPAPAGDLENGEPDDTTRNIGSSSSTSKTNGAGRRRKPGQLPTDARIEAVGNIVLAAYPQLRPLWAADLSRRSRSVANLADAIAGLDIPKVIAEVLHDFPADVACPVGFLARRLWNWRAEHPEVVGPAAQRSA